MKTTIFTAAILVAGATTLFAGSPTKLNLKVEDKYSSPKKEVVVELLNAKDSSLVAVAVSGKERVMEFTNLQNGKYLVYVPNIGTKGYVSPVVDVTSGRTTIVTEQIFATSRQPVLIAANRN
jgi:hypothetical protein